MGMSRGKKTVLLVVALCAALLACVLQLVGVVTAGWMYVRSRNTGADPYLRFDNTLQTGLWYRIECINDFCKKLDFGEGNYENPPNMKSNQNAALAALVFCFFACILAVVAVCLRNSSALAISTIVRISAMAACLISFSVAMIPLGKQAAEISEYRYTVQQDKLADPNPYTDTTILFPYSLFMWGFGGVLILLAVIPLLLDVICHQTLDNKQQFDTVSESGSMMNYSCTSYPTDDGSVAKMNGKRGISNSNLTISTDPEPFMHDKPVYSIRSVSTEHLYHHNRFAHGKGRSYEHQDPTNPLQAYALQEAILESEREGGDRKRQDGRRWSEREVTDSPGRRRKLRRTSERENGDGERQEGRRRSERDETDSRVGRTDDTEGSDREVSDRRSRRARRTSARDVPDRGRRNSGVSNEGYEGPKEVTI
ncbi:uncharacterized protein LOC128231195 [Mya arenaria]|uniref:uncharacterized protein LOC128231195 n=1 Tax=Mya arenaria TaxID=6604 RepID=UPI0022E5D0F6|nr:uncharacterized protein LOC128231195 [Mya arenaria]